MGGALLGPNVKSQGDLWKHITLFMPKVEHLFHTFAQGSDFFLHSLFVFFDGIMEFDGATNCLHSSK